MLQQLVLSKVTSTETEGSELGDSAIGVDPHVERCVTPNVDNDLHDLQLLTR